MSKQTKGIKKLQREVMSASQRVVAGRPVQANLQQKRVKAGGDAKAGNLRGIMVNGGNSPSVKAPVGRLREIVRQ